MIKARVLSTNLSAKPDAPIEVNMEMWVFDNGSISCPDEVVIMTEEEYKALDSVSDILRKSLLDEREKTRKLKEENEAIQKDIKDLEEKMAQEADEVDLCPDGTIVFRKKRVSELEKEVKKLKIVKMDNYRLSIMVTELEEKIKKLEKENKDLKNKDDELKLEISDEFTLNITGGLFYKED